MNAHKYPRSTSNQSIINEEPNEQKFSFFVFFYRLMDWNNNHPILLKMGDILLQNYRVYPNTEKKEQTIS